ncbi:hypothetical protein GPY61_31980 [Massilia sp. NEAU-DD11]|uniref:Uncharacterized protein n=1 Tax=Massilia cellulosiltytica TaxID=2683234 RepID=A0A7X3G6E8_9BURK|nr:hypothetical protein [Telluria cellulosilytica]MVW64541.1 hypothetical protein [Telluria cellulosilytica]
MEDHMEMPEGEGSLAITAATGVLTDLESIWTELLKLGTSEEFTQYVESMAEMPDASGDAMARLLDRFMCSSADEMAALLKESWPDLAAQDGKPVSAHIAKIRVIELAMLDVACMFVVQTIRADVDRAPLKERWELACEARRRLGMLQGYILGNRESMSASSIAVLGANARHKENREMKRQAFEWLSENMGRFKSMDDAAEAVQKVVPVRFRTARDWVGLHKKMKGER